MEDRVTLVRVRGLNLTLDTAARPLRYLTGVVDDASTDSTSHCFLSG